MKADTMLSPRKMFIMKASMAGARKMKEWPKPRCLPVTLSMISGMTDIKAVITNPGMVTGKLNNKCAQQEKANYSIFMAF